MSPVMRFGTSLVVLLDVAGVSEAGYSPEKYHAYSDAWEVRPHTKIYLSGGQTVVVEGHHGTAISDRVEALHTAHVEHS